MKANPAEDWKSHIISLTEGMEARAQKLDASFFPPVSPDRLSEWERDTGIEIPTQIRSFLAQSDGLEAQCGEIWPVLPLEKWQVLDDLCQGPDPWIRFGETSNYRYLLSLGHTPSIYRHETYGSEIEFFAPTLRDFFRNVFRGEA